MLYDSSVASWRMVGWGKPGRNVTDVLVPGYFSGVLSADIERVYCI